METFLAWFIESSLLVMMILVIRKIFVGKVSYAAINCLWLVVLVRFIVPVNFVPAPVNVGSIFSEAILSGMPGEMQEDAVVSDFTANVNNTIISKDNFSDNYTVDVPAQNEYYSEGERINLWTACYVLVSLLLFSWIVMSNICMFKKLKSTRILYGSKGRVKIYISASVKSPCLYGCIRPAIYLPNGVMADEELSQIIIHEYVHYLHKDYIWAMIRIFLISVFWFHPFMWIAVFSSRKDAELFCDETVISYIGEENRFYYGEMLIKMAQNFSRGQFRYSMMTISRSGKELEKRIFAITNKKHCCKLLSLPLFTTVCIAVAITCSTGVSSFGAVKTDSTDVNLENALAGDTVKGFEQIAGLDLDSVSYKNAENNIAGNSIDSDGIGNEFISSKTYQEAFENYIAVFTEAVNTGNTDKMSQVLAKGSDVYGQQCRIAQNYYSRGIKEEVKSCSIISAYVIVNDNTISESVQEEAFSWSIIPANTIIDDNITTVQLISKEKIHVYYADSTEKLVKQKYRYTCEKIDGNWYITAMEDC